MKNIYRYLLIFTASALVVSCGESDLEPTLALDKDLDSGINSATDLGFVLNSAYDRMSVSHKQKAYSRNSSKRVY